MHPKKKITLPSDVEAKVTDLCRALADPSYSHAGNILVAMRQYEKALTPYPDMVNALHEEFIVSPNTPEVEE